MSGDRVIRLATAAVVCAVAAFAAVVSYSHIYDLGRAHGQAGAAARLLPLSVDGLVAALAHRGVGYQGPLTIVEGIFGFTVSTADSTATRGLAMPMARATSMAF